MAFQQQIPQVYLTRDQIMRRVARDKDLQGFDG